VIDIKPYVAALERVRDFEPPAWCAHWPEWVEDAAEFDWDGEVSSGRLDRDDRPDRDLS
jgi:hypothetical protein